MLHPMFEVTSEDIKTLSSEQIVKLVAELAKATVIAANYSATYVTWDGQHTSTDGGVDVAARLPSSRKVVVSLPEVEVLPMGIERRVTYFQVKKSDMPPAKILAEMRPNGRLRSELEELSKVSGTYVIVSAGSSAAHRWLVDRENAMKKAVSDCDHADDLNLEYFTSQRVADWVRQHPGVALWVLEQVGRPVEGWKSYEQFSDSSASGLGKFIPDSLARVKIQKGNGSNLTIVEAINQMRIRLSVQGTVLRVVGLSGVGKTRIAQALFEPDVGSDPLPAHYAIYSDSVCSPNPSPVSLATKLIEQGHPAVIIVDNCNSELHSQLVPVVCRPGSKISLLTIEYDVREDVPVETTVVTVGPASDDLVHELLTKNYPRIERDAHRAVVGAAGGNARIALAIASAIHQTGHLGKLSDYHLFERIFFQRNGTMDDNLMSVASAASLVFSFSVEETAEDGPSSLPMIAALAGLSESATHQQLVKLEERQLLQVRGHWRALLPHALANYLAERALRHFQRKNIIIQLCRNDSPHLLRSFARRLAYFQTNELARTICEDWFSHSGPLSNPLALDDLKLGTFEAAASVAPAAALLAFERSQYISESAQPNCLISIRLSRTLSEVADQTEFFHRVTTQLLRFIPDDAGRTQSSEAYRVIISFFNINRFNTVAVPKARLELLGYLLTSTDHLTNQIGLEALRESFGVNGEDRNFSSRLNLGEAKVYYLDWHRKVISLVLKQTASRAIDPDPVRDVLAEAFEKVWSIPELRQELAAAMIRAANGSFWEKGWRSVNNIIAGRRNEGGSIYPLEDLLDKLAAKELEDIVIAELNHTNIASCWSPERELLLQRCDELGRLVANGNLHVLDHVVPRINTGLPYAARFGESIGLAAGELQQAWNRIKEAWISCPIKPRHAHVLKGFIRAAANRDRAAVEQWLDNAATISGIANIVPKLSMEVGLNLRGVARMKASIGAGLLAASDLKCLKDVYRLPAEVFQAVAKLIVELPSDPAQATFVLRIVSHWTCRSQWRDRDAPVDLHEVCSNAIGRVQWLYINPNDDYSFDIVAGLGLTTSTGLAYAFALGRDLRDLSKIYGSVGVVRPNFLAALFQHQTAAVLSGLFDDADVESIQISHSIIREAMDQIQSPYSLLPLGPTLAWCEELPRDRYLTAAGFVPLSHPNEDGSVLLSSFASLILRRAPNPLEVLSKLLDRIWSYNVAWSPSDSAQANANALFNFAGALHNSQFQEDLKKMQVKVNANITRALHQEHHSQKAREQRFE